jgi:hypothetical protein
MILRHVPIRINELQSFTRELLAKELANLAPVRVKVAARTGYPPSRAPRQTQAVEVLTMAVRKSTRRPAAATSPVVPVPTLARKIEVCRRALTVLGRAGEAFFIAHVTEPGEEPFEVLMSGDPVRIESFLRVGRSHSAIRLEVVA